MEADLCEETRKLLKQQQTLDDKYTAARSNSTQFYGLTMHDTVKKLLKIGDIKQAERIKNDYKMPDRRYCWLRIQVLAEKFEWEELEKFSKTKKSPIGFEPFVEVCLQQNKPDIARTYLPKCRDDKKIKLYIRAGYERSFVFLLLFYYNFCILKL